MAHRRKAHKQLATPQAGDSVFTMFLRTILGAALFSVVLSLTGIAEEYTFDRAVAAAGRLTPKDKVKEFALFNLPEPKAKPKEFLKVLRQVKAGPKYLAITSPKLKYVRNLLADTLKLAKDENLEGIHLVIVAERIDADSFEPMLKKRGITAVYGSYSDQPQS